MKKKQGKKLVCVRQGAPPFPVTRLWHQSQSISSSSSSCFFLHFFKWGYRSVNRSFSLLLTLMRAGPCYMCENFLARKELMMVVRSFGDKVQTPYLLLLMESATYMLSLPETELTKEERGKISPTACQKCLWRVCFVFGDFFPSRSLPFFFFFLIMNAESKEAAISVFECQPRH